MMQLISGHVGGLLDMIQLTSHIAHMHMYASLQTFTTFRVSLNIAYCWKLKTEYYNKIIFKYINSAVGLIFNENFA